MKRALRSQTRYRTETVTGHSLTAKLSFAKHWERGSSHVSDPASALLDRSRSERTRRPVKPIFRPYGAAGGGCQSRCIVAFRKLQTEQGRVGFVSSSTLTRTHYTHRGPSLRRALRRFSRACLRWLRRPLLSSAQTFTSAGM